MNNSQSINWLRLVAEGTAIVISILLAFAVQAWWESVEEERQELEALIGLREEFETNLASSLNVKNLLLSRSESSEALAGLTGPQTDSAENDLATEYLSDILNYTVDLRFAEGTLSSLISSQGLNIVSSTELRRQLASWPGITSDTLRRQERLQLLYQEQLMPFLWVHVPVRTLDALVNNEVQTSRFELDMSTLLSQLQFENILHEIYYSNEAMLRNIEEAELATQQILDLVNSEISRLENE